MPFIFITPFVVLLHFAQIDMSTTAWYDLSAAFGMSTPKKEPMTEERAARIIQAAFKKWLVRDGGGNASLLDVFYFTRARASPCVN